MRTMINLRMIERFFLSRKVATALLALTIVPLIIATQTQSIADIATSPFFLVIPAFIFLSVLLCTLDRLRKRKIKAPHGSAFLIKRSAVLPLPEAVKYLEGKGWAPFEGREDSIFMVKGENGFWGSMVFHAGLLILIISAVITGATLFSASLLLIEGLPTPLGKEGFLTIGKQPLVPVTYPAGTVTMERFEAVFKDERFPVDFAAHLKLEDAKGERDVAVRVNDPLILGGLQYTMDKYWFAPAFRVEDVASGRVLFDGHVSLLPLLELDSEDFFDVPGTGYRIYVRFFPDFEMTDKGSRTRSKIPKNPVFGMRLVDDKGREVERGKLVRLGKTLYMGGLGIKATELRYWAHFGVIRDHGQPLIALSVIVMVAGLVIRFVRHEKWLMVTGKGEGTEIAGYSRYFPALFEGEVERIADGIGTFTTERATDNHGKDINE